MIELTAWLAAIATAVAALELLAVRRALGDHGVFAWSVLRRELADAPAPVRALADAMFGTRGTSIIVALQLASAIALPVFGPAAWIAFACTLAIAVRFRGTYNGGSDAMLVVVLLGLAIARAGWPRAGLAYIAAQLVLSYAIAGIAKLGDPHWRRGDAFAILVALPAYGVPARLAALLARPVLGRLGAFATLAFECGFPIALVNRTACIAALAVGVAFHLGNAIVFGLDRFWWTWLAAYPAVWFTARTLL
ncbi:MAG TPA: HTTM domain-containing protein [Kofleriaceae bacterium]